MPPGSRTYTGALHIHTREGDKETPLEEIVAAAKECSLDFVVLTDHHTKGLALEGKEGWYDGVLVLCGEEVSTPEGHFLAFETREQIGPGVPLDEALDRVLKQFGTPVAIHHQLASLRRENSPYPPPTIPLEKAGLLEIWSFFDEFLSRTPAKDVLKSLARPDKIIKGPERKLLWKWDRYLEHQMLPVAGGLNVHERKDPLLEWKVLFPYRIAFQTICTCINTGELPSVALRARDLVWSALREGRSYIVNRTLGPEKDFTFEYHPSEGRPRPMGDTVSYVKGGRFFIHVPVEAEIVLRHNGQPLFWGTGQQILFPTAGPGSYRVEVNLERRLYILSNPIRLEDEDGILQPTVSDVT